MIDALALTATKQGQHENHYGAAQQRLRSHSPFFLDDCTSCGHLSVTCDARTSTCVEEHSKLRLQGLGLRV